MDSIISQSKITSLKERRLKQIEEQNKQNQWNKIIHEAVKITPGILRGAWEDLQVLSPSIFSIYSDFSVHLKQISLIGVELKELPDEIGTLIHLEILNLQQNKLVRLPDSLCELNSLHTLNLAYNFIVELPERIGFMSSLSTIVIHNNNLITLPNSFTALKLLNKLDFECNKIERLSNNYQYLLNCSIINYNQNLLQIIPSTIFRMNNLVSLSLNNNKIVNLPLELYENKTIKTLRLSKNSIKIISERIGNMVQLEELTLDYNNLSSLPYNFYKLKNLKILRLDGNKNLLNPPNNIIILGINAILKYFEEQFIYDKLSRMRHIIFCLHNILEQIVYYNIYNPAQFNPYIVIEKDNNIKDEYYGLQWNEFINVLLPKLENIWRKIRLGDIKTLKTLIKNKFLLKKMTNYNELNSNFNDYLLDLPFSEEEILWALNNFTDSYGKIIKKGKNFFTKCECKDINGNFLPCNPPNFNYSCYRECLMIKKKIDNVKDYNEKKWLEYKKISMNDALKRSENEALNYINSKEGKIWLENLSYEYTKKIIYNNNIEYHMEKINKKNIKLKNNIIKYYKKKINKLEKSKLKKETMINNKINEYNLKKKTVSEGYLRDILDHKIKEAENQKLNLPEIKMIYEMKLKCEKECKDVDNKFNQEESDSNNSDDLFSEDEEDEDEDEEGEDDIEEDEEDENEIVTKNINKLNDNSHEDNERMNKLNEDKHDENDEENEKKKRKKRKKIERSTDVANILKQAKKLERNNRLDVSTSEVLLETVIQYSGMSKEILQELYNKNLKNSVDYIKKKYKSLIKINKKKIKNLFDFCQIKINKFYQQFNGNFNEIQKELRYELYRQYIEHSINITKDLVKKEFNSIEKIRDNFYSNTTKLFFITWKKWTWTKQTRIRRDKRKAYKLAAKNYSAALESIRFASLYVSEWEPFMDIYTDKPFWKNKRTNYITFDEPKIEHYLPASFVIPEEPEELPEDIPLESTDTSSCASLDEWNKKYSNIKRTEFESKENAEHERRLNKIRQSKSKSLLKSANSSFSNSPSTSQKFVNPNENSDPTIHSSSTSFITSHLSSKRKSLLTRRKRTSSSMSANDNINDSGEVSLNENDENELYYELDEDLVENDSSIYDGDIENDNNQSGKNSRKSSRKLSSIVPDIEAYKKSGLSELWTPEVAAPLDPNNNTKKMSLRNESFRSHYQRGTSPLISVKKSFVADQFNNPNSGNISRESSRSQSFIDSPLRPRTETELISSLIEKNQNNALISLNSSKKSFDLSSSLNSSPSPSIRPIFFNESNELNNQIVNSINSSAVQVIHSEYTDIKDKPTEISEVSEHIKSKLYNEYEVAEKVLQKVSSIIIIYQLFI